MFIKHQGKINCCKLQIFHSSVTNFELVSSNYFFTCKLRKMQSHHNLLFSDSSELLDRSKGQYTEKQVERCGKMAGRFGEHLEDVFLRETMGKDREVKKKRDCVEKSDVIDFVEEFGECELFAYKEGRKHASFRNDLFDGRIPRVGKLKATLRDYSKKLDLRRRMEPE